MEIKTDGIVLNNYIIKDNDNITVLFTEKIGKIYVISRGTKKITSKLKPTLELFSLNHYYLTRKDEKIKYFKLVQASQICAYETIRTSLDKIYLAYLIVELLNKFLPEESQSDDLFELSKYVLNKINLKINVNINRLESFFKLKLLKLTGFNMVDNLSFLVQSKIKKEIKDYVEYVAHDLKNIDEISVMESTVTEANNFVDSYIMHIVDDSIKSKRIYKWHK